MNFQIDEDFQIGGFVPSKTSLKSIILTWYLLISFGHAQYAAGTVGRKTEDDTGTFTGISTSPVGPRTDNIAETKGNASQSLALDIQILIC